MLLRNVVLVSVALLFSNTVSGCKKATGVDDNSNGELQEGISEVKGKGTPIDQQQANLQPVAQHV
jgi:hypothetical protein